MAVPKTPMDRRVGRPPSAYRVYPIAVELLPVALQYFPRLIVHTTILFPGSPKRLALTNNMYAYLNFLQCRSNPCLPTNNPSWLVRKLGNLLHIS